MKAHQDMGDHVLAVSVFVKLMRAAEATSSAVHREIANINLTISQFGVLEALYHLGTLCQKEIASKILKSSGNITMVIDNLEKRGLVLRKRNDRDRRYYDVILTAEGRCLIEEIFPPHVNRIATRFAVLDHKELQTLDHLLRKLGRNDPGKKKAEEECDDRYNQG